MNIVFASDDNYAPFLGIAIYSLFESNTSDIQNSYADRIHIYVMDMNISVDNKRKIEKTISGFNAEIIYLDTSAIHKYLEDNITVNVRSLATYYRLFLPSLLPDSVEKIIYFDCDSLFTSSLTELWNVNVEGYDIAGVLDVTSANKKIKVGLSPDMPYVNAGMLLINLIKWREDGKEKQMIDFIIKYNGNVCYHDQGTINGVCLNKKILHPKFNAMTPFFVMNASQIKKYHKISTFYSETELKEARVNPVFCHLTPYLVDRPWIEGNFHPLKKKYRNLQEKTPWPNLVISKGNTNLEPWVKNLFHLLPPSIFIYSLNGLKKIRVRTWFNKIKQLKIQ